ncbi:STE12 [Paramicrosporidium saccamoebae]|uniref:STE12 n=1 Tax=Paramicrosporidium saccamoebae TaxID=1246581 RepID=A0A2H9TIR3_9FUNG|nr:STE12 [Paramicrosporidium saccamoebae]
MYIYPQENTSTLTDESRLERLDEFLQTGPMQVHALYEARLKNMLGEATKNSMLHNTDPETAEKRTRLLQYRRRGACKKFELPNSGGELMSCILWDGDYYITGTDIIKVIVYRLRMEGSVVSLSEMKKFEEGVFSDLRHLKTGQGARLEEARSEFLEWLCRHGCIRTQKKQKVYYWNSVDVNRLVTDAKTRMHKRGEKVNTNGPTDLPSADYGWPNQGPLEKYINPSLFSEESFSNEHEQVDFYNTPFLSDIETLSDVTQTGTASISSNNTKSTSEFMDLTDFNLHLFGLDLPSSADVDSPLSLVDNQSRPVLPQDLNKQPRRVPLLPASNPSNPPRLIPYHPSSIARYARRDEERRFICNYQFCKRRFKRLEHLKRHVRIHTGERPFPCPVERCGKSFSRSDNLAQHLKIHMANELSSATTNSLDIYRVLSEHQTPSHVDTNIAQLQE